MIRFGGKKGLKNKFLRKDVEEKDIKKEEKNIGEGIGRKIELKVGKREKGEWKILRRKKVEEMLRIKEIDKEKGEIGEDMKVKIGKKKCLLKLVSLIKKKGNGIGKIDIIMRREGSMKVIGRLIKLKEKVKEGMVMRLEEVDIWGVKLG